MAAVATSAAAFAAAQPLAVPSRWSGAGVDGGALWGRCVGSGAEPYEVMVDHVEVRFACSCPSRLVPCKHALALLLLWVRGGVASATPSPNVALWVRRGAAAAPGEPRPAAPDPSVGGPPAVEPSPPPPPGDRDERVARMRAGLAELRRWLHDRMRAGLADPALARYETWDGLAARLVDAQVGGLANRVRRIAGLAGAAPSWHQRVLAELGILGLLADAGLRLGELPDDLADAVAVALGWQVRQAAVLAGVPETDRWQVLGRSDTREDRIEVRRIWLRGQRSGRWAMVLSFAAYGQALDTSLPVGSCVEADVFRYPGRTRLRVLLGGRTEPPAPGQVPLCATVSDACTATGAMVAGEPWLDRVPLCVRATAAPGHGRWWLTDGTGMLPLAAPGATLAALAACTAGALHPVTCEWTPDGLVPLTVHLADRHVDLGRVADDSFVGAA